MRLNEAKKYLNSKGYILEDTETNDYEIEELKNDWSEKRKSRASDKELDKIFWKRVDAENRHMNLVDKIEKAKQFNDTDIVAAFKAIKSLVKTDDWVYGNAFKFSKDYKKEYPPYYLNLEDLTDGTLEQIIKQNKGYNTIIIGARRKINKLGDFVKLELQITPKREPVIVVQIVFLLGDNGKEKIFKVSDYKSAIKYANKING